MPDELRVLTFDPTALLDAEAEVIACTARGEIAIFAGAPMPVLRAAFLRHLLLGLPAPRDPWPVRLPGVRIRGACIDALLDLADCAGPGGAGLPALTLEQCDIAAPIDLSNARLSRLSLRGSRIGEVRARGVRIDGSLDISGVAPLADAAWIDAHAAVIEGDLLGRGALLKIPPPRAGIAHRDARYALRLSGATIRGSLDLLGEFTAIGGVALDTAHVTGDVVARGARIGAGEGDAIGGQAARFDGVVILGDGFVAAGVIWLMGARIAGTLDMNAARLVNRAEDGSGVVLAADTAEIGGSVLLRNGFSAEGAISLRGARIASSLECDGASLTNATADGTGIALAVDHAVIGGAVLLRNGFAAQGAISLIGARIGGNLECDGAQPDQRHPRRHRRGARGRECGDRRRGAAAPRLHRPRRGQPARRDDRQQCRVLWRRAGELVGDGIARNVAADQCRNRRRCAAEPGLHQPGLCQPVGHQDRPRPRLLDGDLHRPFAGGVRTIDGRGDGGDQPGGRRRHEADRRHRARPDRLREPSDRRQPDLGRAAVPARGHPRRRMSRLPHRGGCAAADAAVARADRSGAGGKRPHRGGGIGDRPRRRQGRHAG